MSCHTSWLNRVLFMSYSGLVKCHTMVSTREILNVKINTMQELSNSDGPKSILAYLLSLGIDTLNQLYQDVYACLAVFR